MGVLVVMIVPGDTEQFKAFMAANEQLVTELTDKSRAAGCTAHRFAVGEGEVVVVDEWGSAEQFLAFIGDPELQATMVQMGAQGAPQITFADAKGFPGDF